MATRTGQTAVLPNPIAVDKNASYPRVRPLGPLQLEAACADKLRDGQQRTRRWSSLASLGKASLGDLPRLRLECPPVRAAPCACVAGARRSRQPTQIDLRRGLVEAALERLSDLA
jgi:hypothetical protein